MSEKYSIINRDTLVPIGAIGAILAVVWSMATMFEKVNAQEKEIETIKAQYATMQSLIVQFPTKDDLKNLETRLKEYIQK
jgi:Tfp pilus assembly protein PilO